MAAQRFPIRGSLAAGTLLSVLDAVGMAALSLAGMIFPNFFYPDEVLKQVFIPNDVVNLAIGLPMLALSMLWTRRGHWVGLLLWPGALFYVTYTYIAYAATAPFTLRGAAYAALVVLSVMAIAAVFHSVEPGTVRQRLSGSVPERFTGWVLAGLGVLFFFRSLWQLVGASGGLAVTDTAVLMADLLTTPFWIIGGVLLLRRKPLGYITALGLLFQASMLFVGLLVVFLLQPWLTGQPFPASDFAVVLAMSLICFVPLGLYLRGVARSLSDK